MTGENTLQHVQECLQLGVWNRKLSADFVTAQQWRSQPKYELRVRNGARVDTTVVGVDLVADLDVHAAIIKRAEVSVALQHHIRVVAGIKRGNETVFITFDTDFDCGKIVLICH